MTSPRSVVVVGAGIIGLATAYRLAEHGCTVTVLDPTPARGATWAAAGMIAPTAEIAPGEEANYAYQLRATPAWVQMAADLEARAGRPVTLHATGTLVVGVDVADRRALDQFHTVATRFGATMRAVTRDADPDLFDFVAPGLRTGLFMAEDGWLDPDEAVDALRAALESLGVATVAETVLRARSDESGGVVAETASGRYRADVGVVATGATGLPSGLSAPEGVAVRPVRGVTVRVRGVDHGAQAVTVRALIHGHAFYAVSRPGGYAILGATSEERPEPVVEVGELQRLLRDAVELIPDLDGAELVEVRTARRPATRDLRPFFAALPQAGWFWSSGHYRHGVTLAPVAAADAVAALLG